MLHNDYGVSIPMLMDAIRKSKTEEFMTTRIKPK
jgi:hypothetical protein